MLLQDMYDNYWSQSADPDTGLRTNTGSIKLYGHQRKAQEQMVRTILLSYIEVEFFLKSHINSQFMKRPRWILLPKSVKLHAVAATNVAPPFQFPNKIALKRVLSKSFIEM